MTNKNKKQLRPKKRMMTPRKCSFCEEHKEPWFSDIEPLQRLLTERGKIVGRGRSGLCSKHQRHLTLAIKYARHLALIPYISRE